MGSRRRRSVGCGIASVGLAATLALAGMPTAIAQPTGTTAQGADRLARPGASELRAGQSLKSGARLSSPDRRHVLTMQKNGDLVLRTGSDVVWSTDTTGNGARLTMRADGEAVVTRGQRVLWSSGTGGNPGARLTVLNSGEAVIRVGSTTVWSSAPVTTAARYTLQRITFSPPNGLSVTSSQVTSVNEAGTVAGVVRLSDGSDHPFIATGTAATLLPASTDGTQQSVTVTGVDGAGRVVGCLGAEPVRWVGGAVQTLPVPDVAPFTGEDLTGCAAGVTEAGLIVGWAGRGIYFKTVVRWNAAGELTGDQSVATGYPRITGIDDRGNALVEAGEGATCDLHLADGTLTRLTVVPPQIDWEWHPRCPAISADGTKTIGQVMNLTQWLTPQPAVVIPQLSSAAPSDPTPAVTGVNNAGRVITAAGGLLVNGELVPLSDRLTNAPAGTLSPVAISDANVIAANLTGPAGTSAVRLVPIS